MPSLDTIRTVTIKGKADGVDDATAALNRLTDSIKSANDNLAKSNAAAQDNSAGFRITGENAATAANHLRQAAEAAYAFSPAFRGVVNEMAVPALGAANTALAAVAAGIVTATNVAGTGLVRLGTAVETTVPALAVLGGGLKTAGAAMEAFSPTLTSTAGTILSKLLPALSLLGKGLLIYDAIKLVAQAWQLGGEKLAEYIALSEKAAASGVSTDFFQRISKAAADAKTPVDALTEAFKKLSESSGNTLGGSTAQKRLTELTSSENFKGGPGNFVGNTGVGDLQNANSNQERLVALNNLYTQAVAKGERLAGLDLVKAFGGEQLAANLAKDSGYLDDLISKANSISAKDLISAGDVQRATELQDRLDAAEKILSQRWHPIQDILTNLGIQMRSIWVDIVEAISKAVDAVFKLIDPITAALKPLVEFMHSAADLLGKAAPYLASAPVIGLPLAGTALGASKLFGTPSTVDADAAQRAAQMADARKRLAEGLNRQSDTSHDPGAKPPDTSAYDRATGQLQKYIETTNAASKSVSDAAGEQEKFKAIAELTAAGIKDGLTPAAAALKANMSDLVGAAAAAADALAKAKVASQIDFSSKTAFLSQDDVAIATQLKSIYGNDVPAALNSTYAASIRVNNAFKEISSAIETNLTSGLTDIVSGAKSVGQGFSDMGKAVVTAIEQMIIKIAIVQPLMKALQASIGDSGILGSLGLGGSNPIAAGGTVPNAVGATSVGGAPLVGLHAGGIVGSEATFTRYVHPAYFDNAPRFHGGGIAGDEVPIIARKGEGVFTPAQMAAMGGNGGSQVNVTVQNFGNDNVSVNQKQNGNGGVDLEVMVGQAAASQMAKKGSALRQVTDNRARIASR